LLPVFSLSQIVASRARFMCAGKLHRRRQWPPRPFPNLAGCSLPPSPDLISAAQMRSNCLDWSYPSAWQIC
jgi:hypothetical protein